MDDSASWAVWAWDAAAAQWNRLDEGPEAQMRAAAVRHNAMTMPDPAVGAPFRAAPVDAPPAMRPVS